MASIALNAQVKTSIQIYEDSLQKLGAVLTTDTVEQNRVDANSLFIKTLVSALKEKNSFYHPFENLSNIITIKKADNNKFKIITWYLVGDNGNFRYYGAIQINNPDKLELYPLVDNTPIIKNTDSLLNNTNWYGALYYNMIPVTAGLKDPYYLLLGWKGNSFETTQKVIEVLRFVNGKPVFGAPVFEATGKGGKPLNRVIFKYTSEVSMLLKYLKDEKMIVFDHLSAANEKLKDSPQLYGPDLTYDAYKLKNGKWIYQENLNMKNLPDVRDEFFIDPTKIQPGVEPIRKY